MYLSIVFLLQSIQSFIDYLKEWEQQSKTGKFEFITDSTCYGLKVSLKGALEICTFLVEKCNFKYLMASRLNQDNLEVSKKYCHPYHLICI